MIVTLKELKIQPGRIVLAAVGGAEVIVTVRGVPTAKIIPIKPHTPDADFDASAFGMWANRDDIDDVDGFVRGLRKGRNL